MRHPLTILCLLVSAALATPPEETVPREPITVEDAILRALENNFDVRIAKSAWQADAGRVQIGRGQFDPVLNFAVTRESFVQEQNTREFVSTAGVSGQGRLYEEDNVRLSSGLEGRTVIGTRYAINLRMDRLDNTLNQNPRNTLYYPEYVAVAGFELRQPLWRDFGFAANLAEVRIGRSNAKMSMLEWKSRIVDAVATVLQSYYEMQFGFENIRVRQDAIDEDEALVRQNRRRAELGFLSPLDVRQAEVQVAENRERLVVATNIFKEAQFRMKRAILGERDPGLNVIYEPVGVLKAPSVPQFQRSDLVAAAFSKRFEWARSAEEVQREITRLHFAKNQAAPRVDIVGQYSSLGLEAGYNDAFDEAFNGPSDIWSVGLQVSIPLTNLQGRAQVAVVRRLKEQAELRRKQLELGITLDVDTALSRMETARQRVATARDSKRLAEEAVRIANRQFEVGKLSSFDVLEQRRRFHDARSRELEAVAQLNIAMVQIEVACGTLLDTWNIAIAEAKPKSPPMVWPWTTFPKEESSPAVRRSVLSAPPLP